MAPLLFRFRRRRVHHGEKDPVINPVSDSEARVRENREVARDTWLMSMDCPISPSAPGQFVMVMVNPGRELFLRRPLAILSHEAGTLEILYKLKGQGTHELSRKVKGDALRVLGPLGNGFSLPREDEGVIFVAGGTGLPPIMSLTAKLGRGALVIGARSKIDIPFPERMSALAGVEVHQVTEDGSLGRKGLATDELETLLNRAQGPCAVYACGPHGMLKRVHELASKTGARCEVSLEEYMACGFGVCSACAVKTASGPMRVCTQGPVFDADTIVWSA
jgi:dihydroorotate dehydrogenase electron transfer subunit